MQPFDYALPALSVLSWNPNKLFVFSMTCYLEVFCVSIQWIFFVLLKKNKNKIRYLKTWLITAQK